MSSTSEMFLKAIAQQADVVGFLADSYRSCENFLFQCATAGEVPETISSYCTAKMDLAVATIGKLLDTTDYDVIREYIREETL